MGFIMKTVWLALTLALVTFPVAALADDADTTSPPALTTAQKQAMSKTFRSFAEKEAALHQQLRSQIIDALSPEHRTAVASVVGGMAISPSPDPAAAVKQIDGMLSQGEQQNILAAQNSFVTQSRALHEQMRTELQSEVPSGALGNMHGHMTDAMKSKHAGMSAPSDAGMLVLMILTHPRPMGMAMDHHFGPPPPRPH
jgi:hypothetical protein